MAGKFLVSPRCHLERREKSRIFEGMGYFAELRTTAKKAVTLGLVEAEHLRYVQVVD